MRNAPHPFTLRQLQYAVAVSEELSFRKAAERCAVSQPALSTQLAALEDALGVRLFERDRRHVIPTAAGRDLVLRARSILVSADELLGAAASLGDPLAGTVTVGVIPTLAPYLLPAVAPAIHRRLPRLEVLWLEEKTGELVDRLQGGAIDGALLALEADLGGAETVRIADDPFVLAAPPGSPLASGGEAKVAELRNAPVLLLEEGHCLRDQTMELCRRGRRGGVAGAEAERRREERVRVRLSRPSSPLPASACSR